MNNLADRFWIDRGVRTPDQDGFFEPSLSSETTAAQASYLTTLDENLPCVILLGPPGIGKSTEFQRAVKTARESGRQAEFVSLRVAHEYEEIEQVLTVGIPGRFIFLDALDESPATVPIAQDWILRALRILVRQKQNLKTELRLRISARSADWSSQFEDQLREIWGDSNVAVFELPPLTRAQAIDFVEGKVPDAQAFVNAVEERGSAAFASRPVTLAMLLTMFMEHGAVSQDKVSLYGRGALSLLEESNKNRRVAGVVGDLEPEQRFAIACRIAASTALSTKTVIWDGLYSEPIPPNSIAVADVSGGIEQSPAGNVAATSKNIREVLRTALFRPISENSFEWAHKTFSEFLSAQYIKKNANTTGEILALIRSGIPGNNRVIPQLREVAAWLCALDTKVLESLIENEPGVLLSSDVALESPSDRRTLVARILAKLDQLETYDHHDWRRYYKRLEHEGLSAQLEPFISNRSKNIVVRRTAIDIAESCGQYDLHKTLLNVAFDSTDNDHIRSQATHALTKILKPGELTLLTDLALSPVGDEDDEIKGWALSAIWPAHISPKQLFQSLTKPKNESLIGSYSYFIHTLEIPESLSDTDAIAALDWIEAISSSGRIRHVFDKPLVASLKSVWKKSTSPEVLVRLAKFVSDSAKPQNTLRHDVDLKDFENFYQASAPENRRALLLKVLDNASPDWSGVRLLIFIPWQIVFREDLSWLVKELNSGSHPSKENWFVDLIIALVDWNHFLDLQFVWDASDHNPKLKAALNSISVIELDSDFAKWQREVLARAKQDAARPRKKPISEILREWLDKFEAGDLGAFWQINVAMLADEGGRTSEFTGVLAPSVGWNKLDAVDRTRVVAAAAAYIRTYRLDPKFFAPNTHHRPAAAGYRAFRLLKSEDPKAYEKIRESDWAAWAPAIAGFTSNDSNSERKQHSQIARDCFRQAQSSFLNAIDSYLRATGGLYHVVELVDDWSEESVLEILWSFLRDAKADDQGFERTAEKLLRSRFMPAVKVGEESLAQIINGETNEKALFFASQAIYFNPSENWHLLNSIVRGNNEIARKVISALAKNWGTEGSADTTLSFSQLADLYVWIETLFVRPEDSDKAYWVGPTHAAFDFQRGILQRLVSSGTSESVAAVLRVSEQLPNSQWLRWTLEDAREAQRRIEWVPYTPRTSFEIILGKKVDRQNASDKEQILEAAQVEQKESGVPTIYLSDGVKETFVPLDAKAPKASRDWQQLTFLVVNDEWRSGHGGISTFNRQLCVSLAQLGHKVFCFIPGASDSDIALAAKQSVTVVTAGKFPGLSTAELLSRGPRNPSTLTPDIVIGHDQVTGAPALALARDLFHCPYLHFIHSSPEELEPLKGGGGLVDFLKGSTKAEIQKEISVEANLVLAVGPQLERYIHTHLAAYGGKAKVVGIVPGLNTDLLSFERSSPLDLQQNCLLSGRLDQTLIKGTDLYIQVAGAFQKQSKIKGATFVMRGFERDTMNARVEALQKQYGVKPHNLRPREYVTDETKLRDDLLSASVFLMPSKIEGFGLTGFDAIAAGVPLMASTPSGLAMLLTKSANSFPENLKQIALDSVLDVEPDDQAVLERWAERLANILSDPVKAFTDADDLRKALAQQFTWNNVAEQVTKSALRVLGK